MRIKAGVLLLCVSSNVYAVEICRRSHVLTMSAPDAVTHHERRLAGLRKRLPARGVVGYVTDAVDAGGSNEAWRRFATTQYSLAPLILERTTEHELVLGDFKDPGTIATVVAGNDLLLVEDFGDGVVLFRRR